MSSTKRRPKRAANTIVGSAVAEPPEPASPPQNTFVKLDDEEKLKWAVVELYRVIQHRKSDALQWLFDQLFRRVLQEKHGYRSFFGNPPHKPREPEILYLSQGVLARVAVERSKATDQPIEEAAGWVARQIPNEEARRLTTKPGEIKDEILRWRTACYRPGERRDGFEILNDWPEFIAMGDDGLEAIIRYTLDNPVL